MGTLIRLMFEWLIEQRSAIAGTIGGVLFLVTLILRYGFDTWWPLGIALATLCGVIALVNAIGE